MKEFFKSFKNKKTRLEYLKSILVGIACAVADFFLMGLILFISNASEFDGNLLNVVTNSSAALSPASVVTATLIGFSVSFLLNYILSVFFVFEYGNIGKNKKGFTRFLLFAAFGLGLTTLFTFIGFNILTLNVWIVKIATTLLVFVFNFIARRRWIFNLDLIIDEDNTINL